MRAHRVKKYKSVLNDGGLYQSKNPFIRWYFYGRLDTALKLSGVSKEDIVLEVGAKEGFFVPSLISNADKVFACDINTTIIGREHTYCHEWGWGESLLSLGRKLLTMELGDDATKKAVFTYADASHLPFQDNSLDLVFILDCLEHMPYPANKLAISEVFRVLKDGGVFICSLPIEKGPILLPREIIRRIMRYGGPRYSLKELIRAFIYNEAIWEWKGNHEGFDFAHELRRIKDLFGGDIYISYVPFSLLRTLNPTVIIKAKKRRKDGRKCEEES